MKSPTFTRLLSFIAAVFFLSNLHAQSLYPVSLDEKVQGSSLIVEGTVVEQYSFWNPAHTMIFTSNKVKVHKVFKGSLQTTFIEVMTQGGTVGNENIEASDLAELAISETGIFFCHTNSMQLKNPQSNQLLWDIYSSAQGFIRYDLQSKIADAPFARYTNILQDLYPAVESRTGRSFENKDAQFNLEFTAKPVGVTAVSSFSPTSVAAGATNNPALNLLTITGSDFGDPTGSAAILFDDANNGTGGTAWTVVYNDPLVVSWTNTQIQVRVPSRAGTGLFQVRDETGVLASSGTALNVMYSVLTSAFTGFTGQSNLMNDNALGGYSVVYSTSTLGSGVDLDASPTKATFQRALNTWKEVNGFNVFEAGTTTTQQINPGDGLNTVMFDNFNTGNAVLASGVLAVCYSFNSTCSPVGTYGIRKTEFDIVIRNTGVSTGSTTFENGPCYPATTAIDMESVLLHELGHALNLGHINDNYQGSSYPAINPGKLMHYAVLSGVARKSPDWSAYIGAQYCIAPNGLLFGACVAQNTAMVPLVPTPESKDECPVFPTTVTAGNVLVPFDLEHATSNKNTDPQYTAITCGIGTGITNTAFYAIKTSATGGTLSVIVSGYATSPASQAACGTAGVEFAIYQVSSCPAGQAYPAPYACRTFNGNGSLANITGLAANTNYLIVVDGANSTKANFNLLFNGTAIPIKVNNFNGSVKTTYNQVVWDIDISPVVKSVELESGTDGTSFASSYSRIVSANTQRIQDSYNDYAIAGKKYYRLKVINLDGSFEYSSVLLLKRDNKLNTVTISPNPASDYINIVMNREKAASLTISLNDITGKKVWTKNFLATAGNQTLQVNDLKNIPPGNYVLKIWDGENFDNHKLVIQ